MQNPPQHHVLRRAPARPREQAEEIFRRPEPQAPAPQARPVIGPVKGQRSQPGEGAVQRTRDFVRLANKRVPSAIDAIEMIGNLANPKNYRAPDGAWDRILGSLRRAVDDLEVLVKNPRERAPLFEPFEEDQ